jgi:trimeric autotransporter adhesin
MNKLFFYPRAIVIVMLLSSTIAFSQTREARLRISNSYNQTLLTSLSQEYRQKAHLNKERALFMAKLKGWKTTIITPAGEFQELVRVTEDGHPVYYTTFNVAAALSTRVNHVNSGGSLGLSLDGQNMTAHVWDAGLARTTHQEYDGAGGANRFSIGDGTNALHYHSAHVTGTIIASGFVASAKGMAPHAKAVGYDWNSDLAEATTAASAGMLISNHSYGFRSDLVPDWYFGAYIDESRDWDNLLVNSPYYLMVVAAGNDGSTNYNGAPLNGNASFDKLTGHATSKNNMVVANAQDANINSSGDLVSVAINSSSSQGPTDDLRIKPDITGNGTGVYSTYQNADNAYASITGTSMASPNVAGSLLLLQQHYNNVNGSFMRAATLKGLALHTADDAGTAGPDANYGWGLMNTKRAAQAITQNGNQARIQELILNSGQSFTTTVESDGVSKLIASISWTDPAGTANTGTANLTTPVLVNDLDIRVTKSASTFNPFRLTSITTNATGDNVVDPYERVDVTGATGTYTLTVTHKGTLQGGSQRFSLIVTGITGTPVACTATTPTGLTASSITSTSASLTWTAVAGATYDVRYKATSSATWTTVAASGNSVSLTGLTAATAYEAQVASKCSDGTTSAFSSSATFTTNSVVLTYCASKGNNVADEYINRVQLGSINNLSGANAGYGNFTSLSTNLTRGVSSTITVTPAWTGTVYSEGYSVWIDYNQDGDFTDSGEQVWTRAATRTTPVSGSFTVPSTALIGQTRMRVSMKYNAIPTSCETFTYGEVEDYTVNIQSAASATTSLGEEEGWETGTAIYPNPVKDVLYIKVPAETIVRTVDIVSPGGSTIRQVKNHEKGIDVSNLHSGLYILSIDTNKGMLRRKFLKE